MDPEVQIFSSTKYRIMMLLRKEDQSDLEGLSKKLGISQMAVYKHVKDLESRGLVLHDARRNGVGRPRLVFRPAPLSKGMYPKGYVKVATSALGFIEDRLGKEAVIGVFNRLENESVEEYAGVIGSGSLAEKMRRLASARSDEGYMAESRKTKSGDVELLQHNCPWSELASKYPGICEVERTMLEKVLGTEVKEAAKNIPGVEPCRFVAKARA
jgi:DeoR family suf operon transcriptional repressor